MADLSLVRLRETFGPSLHRYAVEPIKASPRSQVVRLRLSGANGYSGPTTAVAKILTPVWPDDPHGPDRERRLYETTLPHAGVRVPELYGAAMDRESGSRLLFLEDLEPVYRFLAPTAEWTPQEAEVLLGAYARLHVGARNLLPPVTGRDWLMQPWHTGLAPASLILQVHELVGRGIWQPLPGCEELIERTVDRISDQGTENLTLLHNDLYPPNVALPRDSAGSAALVDWEMATWGEPEMDLAYLFLQPYGSARRIDRSAALAHYWAVRASLQGSIPDPATRSERQTHADRVMALALVRVAHRVARSPFPAGSAQEAYWASMFRVLEAKLRDLIAAIQECP